MQVAVSRYIDLRRVHGDKIDHLYIGVGLLCKEISI